MALTNQQLDHISNLANLARVFEENYTKMVLLNYEWNGVPDFDTDITQGEIDAVPSLAARNLEVSDLTELNYIVSNLMVLVGDRLARVVKVAKL